MHAVCSDYMYTFAPRLKDISERKVPNIVSDNEDGSQTRPKGVVLFKTLKSEWIDNSIHLTTEYHWHVCVHTYVHASIM